MTESSKSRGVLVTGGGGFIGGALLRGFDARGWRAIACGPRRPATNRFEWRAYDLGWRQLPDELFEGAGVLVHAAYAKRDYDRNVAGTLLLCDRASRCGVRHIVFLSSLAAHPAALSSYGKQKYELERMLEARGALVVRPGLVVGGGGLFGAMCAYLRGHRVVPLIDGGRQPLQTVYVDDLVDALCDAVERNAAGTFTVAEYDPVAYRDFYAALSHRMRARVRFVAIPFWAADLALRAAGAMRIALPIDRDNLLGLRAMRADRGSRLDPPGRQLGDYRENLARAAAVGVFERIA